MWTMNAICETSSTSAILLILTAITGANCVPTNECNRLKIEDKWYDQRVVYANLGRPYSLNVHKATNILIFSYAVPDSYSDVDFQLAYLNIDSGDHQIIAGIKGGCAVAIDQVNDIIYLGGSDGIYKFNMQTQLADFYKEKGKNIWSLHFKQNLFYVSYPDQKLHIEVDGKFSKVKEFQDIEIDYFHINSFDDTMYFANKTGWYKYDNVNSEVVCVSELLTVRQIVEDNNGNIYVCTNIGVYMHKRIEGLTKIMDMKNIYGLAFDRDNNFMYSDDRNIMMLSFSLVGCDDNSTHW